MGKKQSSSIENRVYLFRELAAAFLEENGGTLIGTDAQREKGMRALGDLAHAACVVADHGDVDGRRVGDMVARGHRHGATKTKDATTNATKATADPTNDANERSLKKRSLKKRSAKKKR